MKKKSCRTSCAAAFFTKLIFILIPKMLIDKIASKNFIRQGEHRKTGCRLSRMFDAA